MLWPNLKFVALPVPEIIEIGVLSGGGEPPTKEKEGVSAVAVLGLSQV